MALLQRPEPEFLALKQAESRKTNSQAGRQVFNREGGVKFHGICGQLILVQDLDSKPGHGMAVVNYTSGMSVKSIPSTPFSGIARRLALSNLKSRPGNTNRNQLLCTPRREIHRARAKIEA